MTTLNQDYDTLEKMGILDKNIPSFIKNNLNPAFELREYQKEAIARFIHYIEQNQNRIMPTQLLFHMATGSGKTLLMAADILYLYSKGYRSFLFFVNSNNIIKKTKDNFLNPKSSKYLFNEKIKFDGNIVKLVEVNDLESSNPDSINIIFTTIQGLHYDMNRTKENSLTYEDFKEKKIVIISDEAHHINAWTRNNLAQDESIRKTTWEQTVNNIFKSNSENIMLEYSATVDLSNSGINEKYQDKLIFEYSLNRFRLDGYSKEVLVLQADLSNKDRMLQAVILSQYRRKIAEQNKLIIKPVILFKSKSIKSSESNEQMFVYLIRNLRASDIERIKSQSTGNILEKAFDYFERQNISFDNLVVELREDFSEEKTMLLDSTNIDEEKQLKLNSLEDNNNEVRAIFAVDMLNEGWDVLNLFDIVRLYDTRDSRRNIPGPTTIAEAQLIGRGARYFPFRITEDQDKFKRKFDQSPENELKIIEELYYHSSHNPRYIQELTTVLRRSGIMPPQEPKTIYLKVKDEFRDTNFWKKGLLFLNKRIEADRSKIRDLNDLDLSKNFGIFTLKSGFTQEQGFFSDKNNLDEDRTTKQFEIVEFRISIIRKALSKLDFYRFNNLLKYFPKLGTIEEFIDSLKQIKVDIRSSLTKLNNLDATDKLEICLEVLKQLESQIRAGYTEYKGTLLFDGHRVSELVTDKTLNINIGDYTDQEYGVPLSETVRENLRLNVSKKKWYVYDENYGTSEEKYFIQFLNGYIDKIIEKYEEVYLIRNAYLFKLYRFSDGKPIEPDFVLCLREKGKQEPLQYQLFVEVKGNRGLKDDEWKEEFLKEIGRYHHLQVLAEDVKYKLLGMPFYNENRKSCFVNEFNEKLSLH